MMMVTNKLRVGRFGPATVEYLVEMGKVPVELQHKLEADITE